MSDFLASNPAIVRLLKSGQSALPLREDFWDVLAHGVGMRMEELRDALEELHARGILRGMAGEANPAHPGYNEAITRLPARDGLVRWRPAGVGEGWASVIYEREARDGVAATQWLKAGYFADFTPASPENLLAAGTDRSLLEGDPVRREDAAAGMPVPSGLDVVRRHFETPRAILPPEAPWSHMARALAPDAAPEADVRGAIAHLVLTRRWRRFAWRMDFTAMGWNGCGLAGWRLDENDAPKAAQALARICGSGDVALRKPTAEFPCNLTAILVAREPGAGHAAARRIGEQWGHPPVLWQDVSLG